MHTRGTKINAKKEDWTSESSQVLWIARLQTFPQTEANTLAVRPNHNAVVMPAELMLNFKSAGPPMLMPMPEMETQKRSTRACAQARSCLRRRLRVRFMSFLYLCFFILSFLCLFTLIMYMPYLRFATCSRKDLGLLSSGGSETSDMRWLMLAERPSAE